MLVRYDFCRPAQLVAAAESRGERAASAFGTARLQRVDRNGNPDRQSPVGRWSRRTIGFAREHSLERRGVGEFWAGSGRAIAARFDRGAAPRPKQPHWALVDIQGLNLLRSGVRLRAEFVCGLACDASEDVEREHAPESVHEGRRGVGGIFVEVDDRAR